MVIVLDLAIDPLNSNLNVYIYRNMKISVTIQTDFYKKSENVESDLLRSIGITKQKFAKELANSATNRTRSLFFISVNKVIGGPKKLMQIK